VKNTYEKVLNKMVYTILKEDDRECEEERTFRATFKWEFACHFDMDDWEPREDLEKISKRCLMLYLYGELDQQVSKLIELLLEIKVDNPDGFEQQGKALEILQSMRIQ